MDPFTAAGAATLLVAGIITKSGHKVTEGVVVLGQRFIAAIRRKEPETAEALDTIAQAPESEENQAQLKQLIERVEPIAASDTELKQLAQEIQGQIQAQSGGVVNLAPLAEKIGVVNQGTVVGQTNNISL